MCAARSGSTPGPTRRPSSAPQRWITPTSWKSGPRTAASAASSLSRPWRSPRASPSSMNLRLGVGIRFGDLGQQGPRLDEGRALAEVLPLFVQDHTLVLDGLNQVQEGD